VTRAAEFSGDRSARERAELADRIGVRVSNAVGRIVARAVQVRRS
jgi:hypothetical protein